MKDGKRTRYMIFVVAFALGLGLGLSLPYMSGSGPVAKSRITGTAVGDNQDDPSIELTEAEANELQRSLDELLRAAAVGTSAHSSDTTPLSTAELTRLTTEISIEQGRITMIQGDAKAFSDVIRKAGQALDQ